MASEGRLFSNRYISDVIEHQRSGLGARIQRISSNEILSRPVDDLVEGLVEMFEMIVPTLDVEQAYASQNEGVVEVPDRFADYGGTRGTTRVMGTVVSLHIPFSGEEQFFEIRPSTQDFSAPRAVIRGNEVTITVSGRNLSAETVKQGLDEARDSITRYLDWQRGEVNNFNRSLPQSIRTAIEARKAKLLRDQNLVANLGYSLKRRPDAPKTYVAPVARKKVSTSVHRPSTTVPFKPEPALEEATYQEILNIMHNMTLVMEHSPTAFHSMGEEALRQHFLVQLNGQFEGEATAETFNYLGKTDILIRREGRNIFIAECKFWGGPKAFLETIDQLLGYLSWRDTKTSIVIFNRNKDFSKVLQSILEATEQHPNKKSGPVKEGDTRFRYKFSNPQDVDRELVLTVMVFDVPTPSS